MAVTHNLTSIEASHRRRLLTVDSYDVSLDLTRGDTRFRSVSQVRFTCSEPGADTFIEIAAESIESATLNGVPVDTSRFSPADGLAVPGLAADNLLVVDATCQYSRDGEGLHRLTDPADGETYLYTHFEANNAQKMYACFDQPDLKARFSLHLRLPAAWQPVSNMPVASRAVDGEVAAVDFEELPRTSTYLTVLCAGPFHKISGGHDGIELNLFCRKSMAEYLEAEELFALTKAGLDHFHRNFGVRFPLPKYDQVAMPEYNSGATENFGCVVYAEQFFVQRSEATDHAREFRAYVMYHEMAHMWFGDLVTPRWWDETWLKESFASWAGLWALESATRFTRAWTTFQAGDKNAAYRADQLSTTHPVHAEVTDVKTGRANFDAITYSKGASVLKQLATYVGIESFTVGLREYFAKHQWGVADFDDLRTALESASGRDLSGWAAEWLRTSGYNTLRPDFTLDADGRYRSMRITQLAEPALPSLRSHRLAIGLYDLQDGVLTRRRRVELDVSGEHTPVEELVGEKQPDVLLLNDDDLTYARTVLDPGSLATVREHIGDFADSLPRALCWSTVWNMLRMGKVSGVEFIELVASGLPRETHNGTVGAMHRLVDQAMDKYVPAEAYAAACATLAEAAFDAMTAEGVDSSTVHAWTQVYTEYGRTARDLNRMREWLDEPVSDSDLRWQLVRALARAGRLTAADIDAEAASDSTIDGRLQALRAHAVMPGETDKAASWAKLADPALSNSKQQAILAGFWQTDQAELLGAYVPAYLDLVTRLWRDGNHERGGRAAMYTSRLPVSESTVAALDDWLADASQSPVQRRLVTEAREEFARALEVRAATR